LARVYCPVVWSNTSVDVGVKVICRFDSLKDSPGSLRIIVDNVGRPQANLLRALTAKTDFPEKLFCLKIVS